MVPLAAATSASFLPRGLSRETAISTTANPMIWYSEISSLKIAHDASTVSTGPRLPTAAVWVGPRR
ncbi:hypothetical protein D3C76_1619600 [compost metagenome]